MLKSTFKTLLQTTEGKNIEITFRKPLENLSGSYKINSIKTGRGKGGSLLLTALNLSTNETITQLTVDGKTLNFGTAMSEYVVNTTIDDVLHGPASVEEDIDNLPKDAEMAGKLRESLLPYLGKEGIKIQIDSKLPSINGVWLVKDSSKSPGVFSQLRFNLVSEDGSRTCEFMTYKFAGVTQNVSIIEE